MKAYYADCDQFDNHRTGYWTTEADAIAAFWREHDFSERERPHVKVYARCEAPDMDIALALAQRGSPSPALGIEVFPRRVIAVWSDGQYIANDPASNATWFSDDGDVWCDQSGRLVSGQGFDAVAITLRGGPRDGETVA